MKAYLYGKLRLQSDDVVDGDVAVVVVDDDDDDDELHVVVDAVHVLHHMTPMLALLLLWKLLLFQPEKCPPLFVSVKPSPNNFSSYLAS